MSNDELFVTSLAKEYARKADDDCESAYRAGWRAVGAAIAERIAEVEAPDDIGPAWRQGYSIALADAEQIARNEVRGE